MTLLYLRVILYLFSNFKKQSLSMPQSTFPAHESTTRDAGMDPSVTYTGAIR